MATKKKPAKGAKVRRPAAKKKATPRSSMGGGCSCCTC